MHREAQQLQRVRQRLIQWAPWIRKQIHAEVTVSSPRAPGSTFDITAKWAGGEHTKTFDPATVIRMGRVSCAKEYAMAFVREVYQKRGVL